MSQHSHLYNDRAWRAKREAQLRAEPLCKLCALRGLTQIATVADHVVPHRGDLDLFWNGELQSLCQTCHSSDKQQLETNGFTNRVGADGFYVDPNHPSNKD